MKWKLYPVTTSTFSNETMLNRVIKAGNVQVYYTWEKLKEKGQQMMYNNKGRLPPTFIVFLLLPPV